MVSVKYSGPMSESSGYSNANRNIVQALHEIGIDLVTEFQHYAKHVTDYGKQLEIAKSYKDKHNNSPIKVLHITPNVYQKHKEVGKYHIGHLFWETTKMSPSWAWYLNEVREIWTGCEENVKTFKASGFEGKIFKFPQPLETNVPTETKPIENVKGFVFGSIFQWIERKDPKSLLTAYWQEFQNERDVTLVIKTYGLGFESHEIKKIYNQIEQWKKELNLPNYPRTLIIDYLLSTKEIHKLHEAFDCFVSAHRFEGWGVPQCFPAGEKLYLSDGCIKNIEEACVGNEVITHNGDSKKITDVYKRFYSGDGYKIKAHGFIDSIICTSEHPIYSLKRNNNVYNYLKNNCSISWNDASKLAVGDFIFAPIEKLKSETNIDLANCVENCTITDKNIINKYTNKNGCKVLKRYLPANYDIGYLLGYYAAEGNIDGKSRVEFACHRNENKKRVKINKIIGKYFGVFGRTTYMKGNSARIRFYSSPLSTVLSFLVGNGAKNKNIPNKLLNEGFIKGFICGWWSGDGCRTKNGYQIYSISIDLVKNAQRALMSIGIFCSITKDIRNKKVCGYMLNIGGLDKYEFQKKISKDKVWDKKRTGSLVIRKNNGYLIPITNIENKPINEYVYNIEVDTKHSYLINGLAVHNCESLAHGKPVISTNLGGVHEWISDKGMMKVGYNMVDVFGMNWAEQYTVEGNKWAQINIDELRQKMRWVFENREEAKKIGLQGQKEVKEKFNFKTVGKLMEQRLQEIYREQGIQ